MNKTNQLKMAMIPMRGNCMLPGMIANFDLIREASVQALEKAMRDNEDIFIAAQKDPGCEKPALEDLYRVGTTVRIKQIVKLPKGLVRVLGEGIDRARLLDMSETADGYAAEIEKEPVEEDGTSLENETYLRVLKETYGAYIEDSEGVSKETAASILTAEELPAMVRQLSVTLPLPYEKRQELLECDSVIEMAESMLLILREEIGVARIRNEIGERLHQRLDDNQKEYVLREQLKLIREELGDDHTDSDADRFADLCEKLDASDEIKEKIGDQIRRFREVPTQSPDSTVLYGYIDTLLKMPWDKMSEDSTDLKKAREILDRDHYGLEKVKERIIEFLAVRMLTKKGNSPILCLVGPPGTGKTSICRSVAEALNRKYIRMSLGGVHDEAEIRGHRRTYVGAMPGRIATSLKKAGVKNPLMVLDEIDKLSADHKGETASAMLEVLDAEQNDHFEDHYIELPIDLSEVMFITTANDAQAIPQPLYDRMEVIEINSYTENEKMHILKDHLLPKQIKAHGLKKSQLSVSDKAMGDMISRYTREAGVRSLERLVGDICRKAVCRIMQDGDKKVAVTAKNLKDFLGNPKYDYNPANIRNEIGIARGLAWTAVGGETLEIEVNIIPGKGELLLTGQLGDVMKESAMAGISWIRSAAAEYKLENELFENNDIHVHVPEGAVPKDGPSAGITIATAMLSALSRVPVKASVAMTGEITLRGHVLPIGGLKEKLLAAKKAGIKTVLIPEKNKNDLTEMSDEITGGLNIIPVSDMKQVLKEAFA